MSPQMINPPKPDFTPFELTLQAFGLYDRMKQNSWERKKDLYLQRGDPRILAEMEKEAYGDVTPETKRRLDIQNSESNKYLEGISEQANLNKSADELNNIYKGKKTDVLGQLMEQASPEIMARNQLPTTDIEEAAKRDANAIGQKYDLTGRDIANQAAMEYLALKDKQIKAGAKTAEDYLNTESALQGILNQNNKNQAPSLTANQEKYGITFDKDRYGNPLQTPTKVSAQMFADISDKLKDLEATRQSAGLTFNAERKRALEKTDVSTDTPATFMKIGALSPELADHAVDQYKDVMVRQHGLIAGLERANHLIDSVNKYRGAQSKLSRYDVRDYLLKFPGEGGGKDQFTIDDFVSGQQFTGTLDNMTRKAAELNSIYGGSGYSVAVKKIGTQDIGNVSEERMKARKIFTDWLNQQDRNSGNDIRKRMNIAFASQPNSMFVLEDAYMGQNNQFVPIETFLTKSYSKMLDVDRVSFVTALDERRYDEIYRKFMSSGDSFKKNIAMDMAKYRSPNRDEGTAPPSPEKYGPKVVKKEDDKKK